MFTIDETKKHFTIDELMQNTLDKVQNLLKVNTIIGEAIDMGNGCSIYPVIKITVGLVSGGGEYSAKKISRHDNYPFVGASGAGFCAEPIAFVINSGGQVKLQTIKGQNVRAEILTKLVDMTVKYLENLIKNQQKA